MKITRVNGFADKLRAYKIMVDGAEVGTIKDGETKQFTVADGRHTVQLKIDWCTSQPITFDRGGKQISFQCGSSSALRAAFCAFFNTKDYMWLKQVE